MTDELFAISLLLPYLVLVIVCGFVMNSRFKYLVNSFKGGLYEYKGSKSNSYLEFS